MLCYHKDWFHVCNSNVALAHPHSSLCLPSPNSLCPSCIIPGILLPLGVFCKSFGFWFSLLSQVVLSATFFLCTVPCLHFCCLGDGLPAFMSWSLFPSALFLSPLCCTDSTMLMLSQPYKMILYLTPLLSPSSVFNFSAQSVCFGLQAS